MAKITERQKSNIIAKWNTGQYTKTQLGKLYKTSEANIRKMCENKEPENAHIVEAQLYLENVKKCEKSAIEVNEINKAVEYRLKKVYSTDNKTVKVYDTSFKILDKINSILEGGKVTEKINKGDGIQQFEPRELNADDALKLSSAVDKISLTTNVNTRFSTAIQLNNSPKEEEEFKRVTIMRRSDSTNG